jgi:hypothetical protein
VQLKYVVMYGSEVSVNMVDTGVAPGDPPETHTWAGQIPTSTLGAGQMLRWRVVATDNTAIAGTGPAFSDPIDNEQYYGTGRTRLDHRVEPARLVLVHAELDCGG